MNVAVILNEIKVNLDGPEDKLIELFESVSINELCQRNSKSLLTFTYYLNAFSIGKCTKTNLIDKRKLWLSISPIFHSILRAINLLGSHEDKLNLLIMICNTGTYYKDVGDDLLIEHCFESAWAIRTEFESDEGKVVYSKARKEELVELFNNVEVTFMLRNVCKKTHLHKDSVKIEAPKKRASFSTYNPLHSLDGNTRKSSADEVNLKQMKYQRRNTLVKIEDFYDLSCPVAQKIKETVDKILLDDKDDLSD
uniref:Uncharacterized protein n=1 Tax=Rhabditophanes sp. KR3021 TaxID=114890 RepID=A0AC35U408_9BILA